MDSKKYYILLLAQVDDGGQLGFLIESLTSWIKLSTPIKDVVVDVKRTNFPLKFKDFGFPISGGDIGPVVENAWGLDGIKEQIRQSGVLPNNAYHCVMFLYQDPGFNHPLGAWTYPNDLQGAVFVEAPCTEESIRTSNMLRILSHEICHVFIRQLWNNGDPIKDDMDLYDEEFAIYSKTGNRSRNLARIMPPEWDIILRTPLVRQQLSLIERLIELLKQLLSTPKVIQPTQEPIPLPMSEGNFSANILNWALAIQKYEGFIPPSPDYPNGSRSYRNHNPGNFRFTDTMKELGAVSQDDKGFCIFPSYEIGFNSLCSFLKMAVDGKLIYNPNGSISDFFHLYAPEGDGNEPNAYALFVAKYLKVDVNTPIKNLS
jgi:hypothetical protein